MNPPAARRAAASGARGFTLVELMMSLAMVLLLTLAVTQIFRVTVTTIGKGNATGEVVRQLDAARIALQIDFAGTDSITYNGFTDQSGILPTDRQPAIIISSTAAPAFMSERDMEGDSDYPDATLPFDGKETVDFDNDGIDETQVIQRITPFQNGRRWFRTDSVSFFTGGHAESQKNLDPTSNGFYGDTTGDESWVWYGHGRVYDGQGLLNDDVAYYLPGEGTSDTNPNHFFANQFALLRTAILLRGEQVPTGSTGDSTVLNDDGTPVLHLRPEWVSPTDFSAGLDLSPFDYRSLVYFYDGTTNQPYPQAGPPYFENEDSRVDVAGVLPAAYRERVREAQSFGTAIPGNADANGPLKFDAAVPRNANPPTWYNLLFARTNGNLQNQNAGRFWVTPQVIKPLNAEEVSQASSYLFGGASEFIVEYAGDFLTQDVIGATTANVPDGVIDFTVDATGTRHLRFYGMPRDVDGRLTFGGLTFLIPGPAAATQTVNLPSPLPTSNALLTSTDTRPLADYVLAANGMTVNTGFPFEKRLPGEYNASDTVGGRDTIDDYEREYRAGDITDWSYLAAWGPGDFDGDLYPTPTHASTFVSPANPTGALRPSLIRVIVSGIDREHRLEEPLSMELIFRVPAE